MAEEDGSDTSRRAVVMAAALAPLAYAASPAVAQTSATVSIAVVSRDRLLLEVAAARRIFVAEREMTAALQSVIDSTRAGLESEERELTRLRATLDPATFAERAKEFDRRMRLARSETQDRAGRLQKTFQTARARLVADLPAVLERVRDEAGVDLLIDAEAVLAVRGALDLTERAIAIHDETVEVPITSDFDVTAPLLPAADPAGGQDGGGAGGDQ